MCHLYTSYVLTYLLPIDKIVTIAYTYYKWRCSLSFSDDMDALRENIARINKEAELIEKSNRLLLSNPKQPHDAIQLHKSLLDNRVKLASSGLTDYELTTQSSLLQKTALLRRCHNDTP